MARTNGAGVAATGRLLATRTTADPFALGLALADGRCSFLARAADELTADQLVGALRAAYPQAGLHHRNAREPGERGFARPSDSRWTMNPAGQARQSTRELL